MYWNSENYKWKEYPYFVSGAEKCRLLFVDIKLQNVVTE